MLEGAHDPGEAVAIHLGCLCSAEDNKGGAGAYINRYGQPVFFVDHSCPLHGNHVWGIHDEQRVLETGGIVWGLGQQRVPL